MGVGGQVEGAERVALTSHVFPKEVPGSVHLQVGLQIRLLGEKGKVRKNTTEWKTEEQGKNSKERL